MLDQRVATLTKIATPWLDGFSFGDWKKSSCNVMCMCRALVHSVWEEVVLQQCVVQLLCGLLPIKI